MAVTGSVATDQRVQRHCKTLAEAGHEVVLYSRDDFDLRHQNGWRFYAELNLSLWRKLRKERCDVLWANDVDTLTGLWLARRKGQRLVCDVHEIMPEVPEVIGRKWVQRAWRMVERMLLPRCDALLTVCESLSEHYRKLLGVQMQVVRNVPAMDAVALPTDTNELFAQIGLPQSDLKMVLYQGSVNLGRGVDWAIDALRWLPECRLVVAGGGDLLEQMRRYASNKPWADRIVFCGRLMPDVLQCLTPLANVGLVVLEDRGLSYHYAFPNRIGDMVKAGVPIVVSQLPEMEHFMQQYGVGEVMPYDEEGGDGQAELLAAAIKRILQHGKEYYHFDEARRALDWKKEKTILTNILEKI